MRQLVDDASRLGRIWDLPKLCAGEEVVVRRSPGSCTDAVVGVVRGPWTLDVDVAEADETIWQDFHL